jgi:threonine/homoserine/homoserine lactone efflux protein
MDIKGGLTFIFGVSASDISMVVLVNFFTTLFDQIKSHKNVVGLAGCIFLVSVGSIFFFLKSKSR